MNTGNRLVTDEIRALVGARAPVRTTQDAVSTSEIRRFAQATFDDARIFHDDAAAKASRFGTRVAPGMFTMLSLRPNIPFVDDTMRSAQPGDDTYRVAVTENLPQPAAWSTLYRFHASDDVEFFRLPHVGDTLSAHTSLIDIYEKSGRNGPLAFYVVRTDWKNQRDELVAREDVNLVWTAHAAKRESAPVQPALPRDPPPMPPARPLDLPRVNFEDVAEGQALPEKMIRVTVPTVVRWQMASESYRRDPSGQTAEHHRLGDVDTVLPLVLLESVRRLRRLGLEDVAFGASAHEHRRYAHLRRYGHKIDAARRLRPRRSRGQPHQSGRRHRGARSCQHRAAVSRRRGSPVPVRAMWPELSHRRDPGMSSIRPAPKAR